MEDDESREQRIARITRLAYGGAQHLHLKRKRKAMTIWTDAVLDEYVRMRSERKPVNK
ncbi:hypothetical protein [Rhizobium sp. PP-F2F-G48]|uniref:hypothetical protein n=1 Tax=Rhizobium sp. PP-F2F-G48 TaxID=2135651 RepID=UPI001404D7B2|nr:hypothetical protein [Rhizobium sp. PP-F2F-G48]